MTSFDNTSGSAGAGRRLEAVQARLDRAVRSARARNAIMLILGVISLGLIGYYLWYAHREFTAWDAEKVAMVGQSELVERMPAAAVELKQSLRERAPQVIATGEQRLRELPDRFASKLQDDLAEQLATRAPEAEEQLYQALKEGIVEADKQLADAGGATGDDEAKFKAMLDVLAHVYGTETTKLLDQLHGRYKDGSADMVAHLEMLAEGKDLTPEHESQRTMIRNFLVLAREYHATSTGSAVAATGTEPAAGATTTAPSAPVVNTVDDAAPGSEPVPASDKPAKEELPKQDAPQESPASDTAAPDAPATESPAADAPAPDASPKEAPAADAPAPAPAAP